MEASEKILDAVLRIHEAPLTASGWTDALPAIAAITRSDAVALLVHDVETGDPEYVSGFQMAPEHLQGFVAAVRSGKLPPWIISMPLGRVIPSSSAMSDWDFSRSAFYNEAIRPQGMFYGFAVKPLSVRNHRVFLTAGRRRGSRDFEQAQLRAMQILVPHIVTALKVGKRLAGLDLRTKAASAAVDTLDTGLILVDAEGKILFANQVAEELLALNEVLCLKEGRLHLSAPEPDAALHFTLGTCAAATIAFFRTKQMIEVAREDRTPLQLSVTPFPNDSLNTSLPAVGDSCPAAIILIADPEKERAAWKMQLRKEFGLTSAEAELALEIMKGDGREAAARRLGISVATVRTHLLHIFDKTGVHRQAELVRLLLEGARGSVADGLDRPAPPGKGQSIQA